ncbi:MAG: gamma subclass chorismate mutase AroQ [Steroidobacteraceae bacterium]
MLAPAMAGAAPGVLRVATAADYAPYALKDGGTGVLRGVDVELARELAVDMGQSLEWVTTSWSALQADADAGRFDIAAGGVSVTAPRAALHPFSRNLHRDYKSPVVRCGEQARFDTLREINTPHTRVIVNPGGTNERFARQYFPLAQLRVHADNATVFDEIRAGRADVMVTDLTEAKVLQARRDGLCAAGARARWEPMQKAWWIAAGATQRAAIDAALARALRRESYSRRLQRWVAAPWAQASSDIPLQLALLADERLAVVVEVARWKWNHEAPIEDLPRERLLLDRLRSAAAARESPVAVEGYFAAQIDAAKQLQRDLFTRWRAAGAGKFSQVQDLDGVLRPRIDELNERMLALLVRWDGRPKPRGHFGPLTTGTLSPAAVELALRPLL